MRLSDDERDEMLAALDMEEWLCREGIEYRRTRGTRGDQLNVKTCPACGKSDWKVYINAETGLGNCFSGSCPKGTFNKYSFVREHLLNYVDSPNVISHIKQFVRETGWRPRRIVSVDVEMESEDLKLPHYHPIPIGGKNLKYLTNRRVSIELAQYFHLGYIQTGFFANRIFIPIHDLDGSLVSFQARDITGEAEQKYLFPKGFASTGRILYNGQNAWGRKHLLLVEGVFDVIGAKLALDEDANLRKVGVIGSFGMSLSGNLTSSDDDQLSRFIMLKEKGLEWVTLMWDGEKKALDKAIIAGQMLKAIGLKVRVAVLPEGRDPSDAAPQTVRQCFIKALELNQTNTMKLKLLPIK